MIVNHARTVKQALDRVDMNLLGKEAHIRWMKYLKNMENPLETILDSENIEDQRAAFASFNLSWYKAVKEFGLKEQTVYYQYCPMAIGNKGAYWFSNDKQINNPYFGDAMLRCGETHETLEY